MKLTKLNKRTSPFYCGTTSDYKNDADVLALKAKVKENNKTSDQKLRVVVRGRKPKVKHTFISRMTGKKRVLGYTSGGNVYGGLANATEFDIYLLERR